MNNYQLKILELNCQGTSMNIALRARGPYDPSVRDPKISILFTNGKEIRRLPVLLQAYFPAENLEEFTIFAKYAYKLSYLFYETPVNPEISFWFEVTYGDHVVEYVPFKISGDVKLDEDEFYQITCTEDKTKFFLKLLVEPSKPPKISIFMSVVRSFFRGLWSFILLLLAIPLLPLFLLEGILAMLRLAKRAPKNKKRGLLHIVSHVRWRINSFTRSNFGVTNFKIEMMRKIYNFYSIKKIKENRVVFISNRRDDLTGNFEFVYDILKDDKGLDIRFVLEARNVKKMSLLNAVRYGKYCASSKVVLVDDYASLLYMIPRRKGTTMIQLWHACGAFKTFGYSRMGKPGGQKQVSKAHRNYDYAIVSSKEIAKFYAEGFGLSLEKAVATGIPRTDIFFDETYRDMAREQFYLAYPQLREKKILVFAPTFRGNGKLSGFYPVEKFEAVRLYEELNKEYAIIIKHHPFVRKRSEVSEEYQDFIIDLSDHSELNDLLFVADMLVTDYSSVIFEAALMDIPMLFFAYDLQRYTATRGFYYEYEKFVPGKIVSSFGQAITAIKNKDFEQEKIKSFKTRFFDDLDGKSTERVVELIKKSLDQKVD